MAAWAVPIDEPRFPATGLRRWGRFRRSAWLYRRCLGAQLRAVLQYEADFWVLVVAAALTQCLGLVFISAIFSRLPAINGWKLWDVLLIYAMVFFAEGVVSLGSEGVWRLARLVNAGTLDAILVRPLSPVLQVMSSDLGTNGIGNIGLGVVLIGLALAHASVHWSAAMLAAAVLLVASGIAVKLGVTLASTASAFWLRSPYGSFPFAVHQLGDLCRYPITVYSVALRAVLVTALPFAFVSFVPASALLHHGSLWWVGWLTPLVGLYTIALGAWLFRVGLRRYESTGN
jgi:ABC-2 type transport system permease protein